MLLIKFLKENRENNLTKIALIYKSRICSRTLFNHHHVKIVLSWSF